MKRSEDWAQRMTMPETGKDFYKLPSWLQDAIRADIQARMQPGSETQPAADTQKKRA
jgi:hypothetical protein